jgi:DNA polymerase (family X)
MSRLQIKNDAHKWADYNYIPCFVMTEKIRKNQVARILEDIGTLLDLKGESPFKSRAYYNAARQIETLEEELDDLIREGRLSSIKGIGIALCNKITELATTGTLKYYENLKASVPSGHIEMLKIPGLGTKKIRALHERLGIESIGELEYACIENRLIDLPGFGFKTQEKILAGIEHLKRYKERHLYSDVIETAENLLATLQQNRHVISISLAGSIRRCNETIKDIDLLASSGDPAALANDFAVIPEAETVIAKGDTKVSIILKSGINVDLRIVGEDEFPYALHHFTGSKEHNVAMRGRAKLKGLKMNEYGLFENDRNIICKSEHDIFSALGLAYIPPELREDMGEIEAAELGAIPSLVHLKDIRGILHIHTSMSDGKNSLDTIVNTSKKMGLEYIGISDHSESARYAGGLTPEEIRRQHAEIDEINRWEKDFRILKGIEADILPDGRLDYDDDTLSLFDFVIAAVHSHFGMSEDEMTNRVMRAVENKHTTILAHPTGRLLLAREPYAIDLRIIIDFAAAKGKAIELNANPYRLDLDWRLCQYARKLGVHIAINPDAHDLEGLQDIRYGVNIARKGWLEPADCLNCLGLTEIQKYLS